MGDKYCQWWNSNSVTEYFASGIALTELQSGNNVSVNGDMLNAWTMEHWEICGSHSWGFQSLVCEAVLGNKTSASLCWVTCARTLQSFKTLQLLFRELRVTSHKTCKS